MRNKRIVPAVAAMMVMLASASQGQSFDLSWTTVDGGGAMFSTGGIYQVGATIGQPDAGVASGGVFQITGGFWAGAASNPCDLPGDLDRDRDVDLTDLATLLSNFGVGGGASSAMGDTDGDGDVDLTDLASLLSNFGANCP